MCLYHQLALLSPQSLLKNIPNDGRISFNTWITQFQLLFLFLYYLYSNPAHEPHTKKKITPKNQLKTNLKPQNTNTKPNTQNPFPPWPKHDQQKTIYNNNERNKKKIIKTR